MSTYTRILEEHFEQDRGSNQVKNWNLMRKGQQRFYHKNHYRQKNKKNKEDTRKELELVKKINKHISKKEKDSEIVSYNNS